MTAEPRGIIRLAHAFGVPADRVFDAWLCPEKVARWLHPDAVEQATRVEIDARVGGSIRAVTCRAGRTVEHTGEYLEIQRPHRLSFTIRSSASAATERVTVLIEPRGAGCFLTLTSRIEPAPLRAFAAVAGLEAYRAKTAVRSHWPRVEGKAALSLGVHLAMLPLLPIILREPAPPPDVWTPTVLAMMIVDIGTAEGMKLPRRSDVPAMGAPGEAPAMPPSPMEQPVPAPQTGAPPTPALLPAPSAEAGPLPPPPSAPAPPVPAQRLPPARPAPHGTTSRNTLVLPRAVNSSGAAPQSTTRPGLTIGTGGASGGDGDALGNRTRAAGAQVEAPLVGTRCSGTVSFSPEGNATYYGGQHVPVQGRFFRDQDGRTWIRFTLWPGAPWNLPVKIAGSDIRWTGVNGNGYALRPVGKDHLTGFAGFATDSAAKIDFICARSDADAS